jgi:hypothetical protein
MGCITPSRARATTAASADTVSRERQAASQRARWASQRAESVLGNRSSVRAAGCMPPRSDKKGAPSRGVQCAMTNVPCRAARGVHSPPTMPARSARGQRRVVLRPAGRYRGRVTVTGPAADTDVSLDAQLRWEGIPSTITSSALTSSRQSSAAIISRANAMTCACSSCAKRSRSGASSPACHCSPCCRMS